MNTFKQLSASELEWVSGGEGSDSPKGTWLTTGQDPSPKGTWLVAEQDPSPKGTWLTNEEDPSPKGTW